MAPPDLSDLKPLYLVYGSEELLLERAVRRLRDRVAAVADLDFNMDTFSGESATADEIVNAANTLPFMSERRLVVVRDADKLDAAAVAALVEYAKDPAPSACVVLVATKIAKNSKLFRAVSAGGVVFEYTAPRRSEYASEAIRLFRERGRRVSSSTAQSFVDLVGRDLRRLDIEADKIVAYAGQGDEVTLSDVRAVASAGPAASVFELADAVGARDTAAALGLLRGLLTDGESGTLVHAMLARHLRALIGARALLDRGVSVPEVMAPQIGMAPWQAKNAARQALHYTPQELSGALRGLTAAEEEMKTSPAEAGLVLERWIVRTCSVTSRDAASG